LILNALPEAEQAMVERWERVLGLPQGGWFRVPGFRNLITLVATLDGTAGAAGFLETAEQLGFVDDGSMKTHPADGLSRTHRNWLRRAGWGRKKVPARKPHEARSSLITEVGHGREGSEDAR